MPMRILVCGNPTLDELVSRGKTVVRPGGSALFASSAAGYLGSRVAILGNIGPDYPSAVLKRLRKAPVDLRLIAMTNEPSARFRIARINGSRSLRLVEPGSPIPDSRPGVRFHGVHLGPVFNEISDSLVVSLRKRCDFLSADLQGFIRVASREGVVGTVRPCLKRLFGQCDMVQASIEEASSQARSMDPRRILSRFLSLHVRYAIVTMGDRGSLLGSHGSGGYFVPAFPEHSIQDSTGAGDVFAGSWLSSYLSTKDPVWASAVGSAFASLACRRRGLAKFQISRVELLRRAAWVFDHVERGSVRILHDT